MKPLLSPLAAARDMARRWQLRMAVNHVTGRPVCIQATRMAYEAFRLAGFLDVAPMSVELVALNPAAVGSIEQKRDIDAAYQIEVGPDIPEEATGPGGWSGHLVLDHPTFLLDLVFAGVIHYLEAPGFGNVAALCAAKGSEIEFVNDVWMTRTGGGALVTYRPTPQADGWRDTDAWNAWTPDDESSAEFLATVIRTVAERGA